MQLHLASDASEIVRLAERIAHDAEMEYVGTEHILLALLRQEGNLARRVLERFAVDEARVQASLSELLQRAKEDTWVFGRLPGTPHYRNVIALAIDEASQLEDKSIRSEHLLLALLREKDSAAQQVLLGLGVSLKKARDEVLRLRGAA